MYHAQLVKAFEAGKINLNGIESIRYNDGNDWTT
jgi:hypothetical protein